MKKVLIVALATMLVFAGCSQGSAAQTQTSSDEAALVSEDTAELPSQAASEEQAEESKTTQEERLQIAIQRVEDLSEDSSRVDFLMARNGYRNMDVEHKEQFREEHAETYAKLLEYEAIFFPDEVE